MDKISEMVSRVVNRLRSERLPKWDPMGLLDSIMKWDDQGRFGAGTGKD